MEPELRGAPDVPAPWGFWATFGWALAAIAFGLGVHIGVYYALASLLPRAWPANTTYLTELFNIVFLGAVVGALAWAARHAGWSVRDYFALVRLRRRDVLLVIACAGVMWIVGEAARHLVDWGKSDSANLISEYRTAPGGLLLLRWFGAIVTAPISEEALFRGFLYRGWSQSRLNVSGTILLTAVLFGLFHYQYGWYGRCEVGFFAILAGWLRWRTGSLIPPMLFHAVIGGTSMLYIAIAAQPPA